MRKFKVVLESTASIQAEVFVDAEDWDDAEEKVIADFENIVQVCDWQVVEVPMYSDEVYVNEVEEVVE